MTSVCDSRSRRVSDHARLAAPLLCGAILAGSLIPSAAAGQSFIVERFRPAPLGADGFAVDGADQLDHLEANAALTLSYARKPLVLRLATGDTYAVIRNHSALTAGFALGLFGRVTAFVDMPFNVVMSGNDPPDGIQTRVPRSDGVSPGDARIGARVGVLGSAEERWSLAVQAGLTVPTGDALGDQLYAGESMVTFEPRALAQLQLQPVIVRASLGARLRQNETLPGVTIGDELTAGLGVEYALLDRRLRLIAEAYGATFTAGIGEPTSTPMEALLGAKYQVGPMLFGLAGGPGLGDGVGTPRFRGIASVAYVPMRVLDRDADGLPDRTDSCADAPEDLDGFQDQDGCPDPDNDGDGVEDRADQCPGEAEDQDGFQDRDGCPDPDNDGDGVEDGADQCPGEAEDTDGYADEDGCPEPDNDGDGVEDSADQCPGEAEDADGHEDQDGCPDPDNDGDGVPDDADECPLTPGEASAGGCLPSVKVDAEKGQIVIMEKVEFAPGKDTILERSRPLLEQIHRALVSQPQLTLVRVEGHTDARGRDASNLDLSRRRARAVVRWLADAGIDGSRLTAFGCGETQPIADNNTAMGRQENRRVEFHILEPAPAEPRTLAGCVAAD